MLLHSFDVKVFRNYNPVVLGDCRCELMNGILADVVYSTLYFLLSTQGFASVARALRFLRKLALKRLEVCIEPVEALWHIQGSTIRGYRYVGEAYVDANA